MQNCEVGKHAAMARRLVAPAFGGGYLDGNNLVRLVYMDESGMANPKDEPHVLVSAVIVNADKQLLILEEYLQQIARRHIPEKDLDSFVFHAFQLFNGYGYFEDRDEWPWDRRFAIADELSEIPDKLGIPFTYGWVERKLDVLQKYFKISEDATRHEITVHAHIAAYALCAINVECWMRQNTSNEICMLVIENNEGSRTALDQAHKTFQSNSSIWANRAQGYFPFKKIKERALFDEKSPSSALQFADYCAYVFKRLLLGDERYSRFFDPMSPYLAVPENLPERPF